MPEANQILGMYLHLARASDMRRQPMVRDKLLVLAGVHAERMGLEEISALCRHRVLGHNARHMLRQWPTLTDALDDPRFQSYLKQLRRRYSSEKIEHMLHSLGIELGREREAYFSDLEYAAALLDTRPEAIESILATGPGKNLARSEADASRHQPPGPMPSASALPRVRNLLIVWAPMVVGLLSVAIWLLVSRAL